MSSLLCASINKLLLLTTCCSYSMDPQPFNEENTTQEGATQEPGAPAEKTDYPDDHLDQEIQKALAQHDLAQRLHGNDTQTEDHVTLQTEEPLQTSDDIQKLDLHIIAHELKHATDPLQNSINHDETRKSGAENGNDDTAGGAGISSSINAAPNLDTAANMDPNIRDHIDPNIDANLGSMSNMDNINSMENSGGNSGDHKTAESAAIPTYIPPDSELLATNSALAAYNALASQAPAALVANAHLAAVPLPVVAPSYLPPRIQLLVHTLPVLDNLATQLLRMFAGGPYQTTVDVASHPETAAGAAFRQLVALFESTKCLYSEDEPFLTVDHVAPGMWHHGDRTPGVFRSREQTIELTLRKANLATFLAATLGVAGVGFYHLNESFLDVFCPANSLDPAAGMYHVSLGNALQSGATTVVGDRVGRVLKPQALLYLDLKTQAYISAVEAGERTREDILADIFPGDLAERLLVRRGAKTLSPTESDFVARCHLRRDTLLKHTGAVADDYDWFEFLRDLFEYVGKNMAFLIWGKKPKHTDGHAGDASGVGSGQAVGASGGLVGVGAGVGVGVGVGGSGIGVGGVGSGAGMPGSMDPSVGQNIHQSSPGSTTAVDLKTDGVSDITALLPSEIQEQQIHMRMNPRMQVKGMHRRPWTRDEEKALRHALELKGTQWSTILELFGQGGRINEALKNRTQVQLKDKARNWKMFFLKSGLPVPAYLQKVTGDLDRDDKVRAKNARNRKAAAAPVPAVAGDAAGADRKRRRQA